MSGAGGKVACLGPAGSYSELAAIGMCPQMQVILCRSFPETIAALVRGEADCAVIPIENSIQGGVLQNMDLLEREKVFAVEETVLRIDHRLATKAGVPLSRIERVFSHEQAIGQCAQFLNEKLPHAQCIHTSSTAESLSRIDDVSAGIVGAHAAREGVVLSEENIADEKRNFTRFLRLVRREGAMPEHSGMVFLCAVCEHRAGALLGLLQIFARHGLNLTRIESRPIKDVLGEYRFFIEFAGDVADKNVIRALAEAENVCRQFRILGAYNETQNTVANA